MCYIAQPKSDGSVRLFDARRVTLSLPSVDDMLPALSGVVAPDGSSYSFVSSSVVSNFGLVKDSNELFVLVITSFTTFVFTTKTYSIFFTFFDFVNF